MQPKKNMIHLIIPRADNFHEIIRFPNTPDGLAACRTIREALRKDDRPHHIADLVVDIDEAVEKHFLPALIEVEEPKRRKAKAAMVKRAPTAKK